MFASLTRRPFAAHSLCALSLFFLSTDRLAYQDLASLLVNQPQVAERARTYFLSNPMNSLRAATFSLPRPVGASIPLIPASLDITGSIGQSARGGLDEAAPMEQPQTVNRSAKADRLPMAPLPEAQTAEAPTEPENEKGPRADHAGTLLPNADPLPPSGVAARISRLFFNTDAVDLPAMNFEHRGMSPVERLQNVSLPDVRRGDSSSIASKGIVTGEEGQPRSPAERLGLIGMAARTKAEKCLAEAVYFESRGEVYRGQVAVAQVVVNRAFSGFYPEDICGVVYQNAHRYLACQFTFACEGKKLIVTEHALWKQAQDISRDMLDGKIWLSDVGKATHYHAYWVNPSWVREMRTIQRIGVHTFYRPRAWEG
jgi:hypothetical protein